jgi:hypothetical protein
LFNFRIFDKDFSVSDKCEDSMIYYSFIENFNQSQIKSWKSHPDISISEFGGHIIKRPDPMIYPTRFILKHYPVRSLEHAKRKIINERKNRFSTEERIKGWHLQYNHIDGSDHSLKDFVWDIGTLKKYDHNHEMLETLSESSSILSQGCSFGSVNPDFLPDSDFVLFWQNKMIANGILPEHSGNVFNVSMQLAHALPKTDKLAVKVSPADKLWIESIIQSYARKLYLTGRPSLYSSLGNLSLQF